MPAKAFTERFYNSKLKGYGISSEDLVAGLPLDVDVFMSSHLGLLSLYCGGKLWVLATVLSPCYRGHRSLLVIKVRDLSLLLMSEVFPCC